MRGSISRTTKLAVSTALACVLVLGPLGLSGASADLDSFSSQGTGFALRVAVDLENTLPQQVKDLLGDQVPLQVDQYFIRTLTDATNEATEAASKLGDGFLDLESISISSIGEASHSEGSIQIPSIDLPLLSADVGELFAEIAEGPVVDAHGALSSVDVSLVPVGDIDELAELKDAIGQVVDALNDAVDTLREDLAVVLLDEVHGLVEDTEIVEAVCDETEPLTDPLGLPLDVGDLCDDVEQNQEDIVQTVKDLLELPEIPNPFETGIATVEGLVSDTISQRGDEDVVSATSTGSLKSANVLDGFLSVDLVNLSSTSQAAGTPGSASNAAECSIADVLLGDTENGVSLDGDTVYVGGEEIPLVGDAVAEVKAIVDQVLGIAGLSIELCDEATAAAADDGTSASQSLSAFKVEFAPVAPEALDPVMGALGYEAGAPLLYVLIDPTVQTAVSAQPAVADPKEAPVQLPRTGAPALFVMFVGAALTGGALLVRRWANR